MMKIKSRILPPPRLSFRDSSEARAGEWDMRGKQFFTAVDVVLFAVLCFEAEEICTQRKIDQFIQELRGISRNAGLSFAPRPCKVGYGRYARDVRPMVSDLLEEHEGLQLVLVILPGKSRVYGEVKRVGDTLCGIATQCVQFGTVAQSSPQMLSNLCLKINAKLGGANCVLSADARPALFDRPVIVVGAYLLKPAMHDEKKFSTTALVASMDAFPSRYVSSVRVQSARPFVIRDFRDMLHELLLKFQQTTKFLPDRIILYRNGLPVDHTLSVSSWEICQMQAACRMLGENYEPGITYITTRRRHHTRLFIGEQAEGRVPYDNVLPGTVVDSHITHPRHFDFYICSHIGKQGTSRLCLYHIVLDEGGFKSDQLQMLSYNLCYTYARCTRSVSLPAPVHYAYLAACRARFHMGRTDSEHGPDKRTLQDFRSAIQLHQNADKGMYFA